MIAFLLATLEYERDAHETDEEREQRKGKSKVGRCVVVLEDEKEEFAT